jgi:predicted ATPase/class 3 adenylate cyclase
VSESSTPAALPEGRVALLFTDIEGSTALLLGLGDAYGDVLAQHDEIMRSAWSNHGGVEVDNEGDSFFVVFDEPARAVAAAHEVQTRIAQSTWPDGADVRVRMGLHAGRPHVHGRRYWGIDVNYAARLCSAAHGGQVLMSASMKAEVPAQPVESLGEHGLKDFATPRELFHVVIDGSQRRDFPPPRTLTLVRTNLPSLATPIVGRDAEISELSGRLMGSRLVTLVGRGGVGKTRTAIACAERLASEFGDGVTFVALASADNAESALTVISDAVAAPRLASVEPIAGLIGHLRDRHVLLVLDNTEHLPDLGPGIAALLDGAGQLHLLVTSQAPLGIRGESVMRLEPLRVPAQRSHRASDVGGEPAAELFVERVRSKDASFQVTDDNAEAVARLCVALEGMPLALELAAARAPVLGVQRLVQALERDPDALGEGPSDLPTRQRGLRAALEWTVSLLDDRQRDVFAGLAAFAAAWTLDEAEQMFVGEYLPEETWDALSRLVDLSLVTPRGDGRFTMAERVRRHAVELLATCGREDERRRRHADLMADAMDRYGRLLHPDFFRVMANVEDAVEETIHALAWASEQDKELHRRLVAMSALPFSQVGRMHVLAEDVLSFSPGGCLDRTDGYLLLAQSLVHGMGNHDPAATRDAASAAADCLRQHGSGADRLVHLTRLVSALLGCDQLAEASRLLGEARAYAAGMSEPGWVDVVDGLGLQLKLFVHDLDGAERQLDLIAAGPSRTDWGTTVVETYRADIAFEKGDFRAAVEWYTAALIRVPESNLDTALFQVQGVSAAFAGLGHDEHALELLAGMKHVYRSRTGQPISLVLRAYVAVIEGARSRLTREQLEGATARGDRMTYDSLRARTLELAKELGAGSPAEPE